MLFEHHRVATSFIDDACHHGLAVDGKLERMVQKMKVIVLGHLDHAVPGGPLVPCAAKMSERIDDDGPECSVTWAMGCRSLSILYLDWWKFDVRKTLYSY